MSVTPSLTVAELAEILSRTEPAALLVSPRILRRVIKKDRGLTGPGLQVPHRKSYVIDRERLLAHRRPRRVGHRTRPRSAGHAAAVPASRWAAPGDPRSRGASLLKYWRLLFHARIHLALQARSASAGEVRGPHPADRTDRVRRGDGGAASGPFPSAARRCARRSMRSSPPFTWSCAISRRTCCRRTSRPARISRRSTRC